MTHDQHPHTPRHRLAAALLPCAIALSLAACGGGGSNVRSSPPTTPTTPSGLGFTPNVANDASVVPNPPSVPSWANAAVLPQYSEHLRLTNAAGALGAGLTGAGVTIGLVDSGVNRNHPALSGRVTRNFTHVSSPPNNLSIDDVVGHGTVVAQMAAGKGIGSWGGGVAQSASIVSSRIISDERPTDDGSGEGNEIHAGEGYGDFFKAINGELGDVPNDHPHEPPLGMKLPAMLLVIICIAVGLAPALTFGPLVHVAATALLGQALPEYHLAIWHGFNLPLLMSAIALAVGVGLYLWLAKGRRLHHIASENWFGVATGRSIFEWLIDRLFGLSGRLTARLETGSLQRYVGWLLLTALVLGALPFLGSGIGTGTRPQMPATPLAWAMWALLLLTCIAIARTHHQRFQTVVLVGVVGVAASLTFLGFSAPDLALTQLSVDIVSTVLLLMGLALLPQTSPKETPALRKGLHALLALGGGAAMSVITWLVLTRDHESISWYFLQESLPKGGGTNVVNVILVDFRGYDTMGEITVLGIAAVGVLALMDGLRTRRPGMDPEGRAWTFAQQPLLLRVAASVVLPLALVFSLYIFMRGHNLPGGGFIAGLITAVALVLQFMSLGQARAEQFLRAGGGRRFVRWVGSGLGIAGLTGVGAFALGRPFLTSAHGHPHVPMLGELPLATAAIFDLGVYLTVVGSTLLTISVLGQSSRELPATATPTPRSAA